MLGIDAAWASAYVPVTTFTYFHHHEQVIASRAWQAQFELDMRGRTQLVSAPEVPCCIRSFPQAGASTRPCDRVEQRNRCNIAADRGGAPG